MLEKQTTPPASEDTLGEGNGIDKRRGSRYLSDPSIPQSSPRVKTWLSTPRNVLEAFAALIARGHQRFLHPANAAGMFALPNLEMQQEARHG